MDVGEARTLKKQGQGSRDNLREKLKQQCITRAKQARGSLLAKLRVAGAGGAVDQGMVQGLARDLIQGEFMGGRDSFMTCVEGIAASRPHVYDDGKDEMSDSEYIDLMHYLEEAVIEELRKQEQEILSAHAQYLYDQERAEVEVWSRSEHQVICPVCLKHGLHSNKNVIFCACGIRICTHTDQVEESLHERYASHHGSGCPCQPMCSVHSCGGYDMLMLSCMSCDFLDIVV